MALLAEGAISDRLSGVLDTFFLSQIPDDTCSPDEFNLRLEQLFQDTLQGHSGGTIDKKTVDLAYAIADTIETLSESLLELDFSDERIADRYKHTFSDVVDRQKTIIPSFPSTSCNKFSAATYIEPAYRWLVDNLHNPYPSREVRHKICRDTNTANKDLDNWFTNARRRIGWNTLLKSFDSDRDRLVEAATACFGEEKNQYDPIAIAFSDM
ncbi:homeobox KN domain-containing protein, partial [Armillaria novae-zelandiae]